MESVWERRAMLPVIFKESSGLSGENGRMAEWKSSGRSSDVLDDEANGCLLGFNTLGQLELDEGPGKIVFLMVGLEVDIAFQIVGEVS